MSAAAQILPFLAQLKQQQAIQQEPDVQPVLNPAQPQQQPAYDPNQAPNDIAQSTVQDQQAPKFQETKGHKLMRILQAGVQGGLNGMAANAQTYAATGRNAGFGGGFAGAEQMPFLQAQRSQALQQGQAQIDLLHQQAQNINVPGYGSMPAGLAKVLFPSLIRGQATTQAATIGAQGRQGAAQIGADARVKAAQLGLGPIVKVPQDLQDQFGLQPEMPLRMLNMAESAANKPLTVVGGENDSYVVNKQTNSKQALGVGNRSTGAAMSRPVQVVNDPNNPGNITYSTAGAAIKSGAMAPGSAPTQTAKATAKELSPGGKVGSQVTAFNTAIQHADLLTSAVTALNNGDQQTLNSLKNRLKNEFGIAGPVTAEAIGDAYTREVTKMLSGGHMTDSEIGTVGKTLNPSRQSPEQVLAVINAYKNLAQSKMNVLQQGVQKGLKGQANFPDQQQHVIQIGNQKYQYKGQGATDDLRNYDPIQ